MDDDLPLWRCKRWTVGDLVVEHRYRMPRYSPTDSPADHRDKTAIKRDVQAAASRNRVELTALRLAALGPGAEHYQLTFAQEYLPGSYREFCRLNQNFSARLRRLLGEKAVDCVTALEGLHGDHRYHEHFCCPGGLFTQETLAKVWRYGFVLAPVPVLKSWAMLDGRKIALRSYHDLAAYFHKEGRDGIKFPVGCHPCRASMHLIQSVPPPVIWVDLSGDIPIPEGAEAVHLDHRQNRFGGYSYASYINARGRPRACNTIL